MGNKWRRRRTPQAPQAAQSSQAPQAQRRPRLFDPGWRDRPFVKRSISLSTPEAKSLGNSIPFVASAACIIGFALQRYVDDIRVLSLLESVDEEIFKTLGKDLENECARLITLASEEGVKEAIGATRFPNPVKVDVEITHPYGVEYAKMVENMDKLVISLWDLHNSGIIDPVNLNKTKEKWYHLLRDAGRRISLLARETLDQARQEKALKDQKEAAGAQEEAAGGAAGAAVELPSAETKEPASLEVPEAPETVPGGNGRRSRKTVKTTGQDSEPEENGKGASPEPPMLEGGEELPPALEQAV